MENTANLITPSLTSTTQELSEKLTSTSDSHLLVSSSLSWKQASLLEWLALPQSREFLLNWLKSHAPEKIPTLNDTWSQDNLLGDVTQLEKTFCDLHLENIIADYLGTCENTTQKTYPSESSSSETMGLVTTNSCTILPDVKEAIIEESGTISFSKSLEPNVHTTANESTEMEKWETLADMNIDKLEIGKENEKSEANTVPRFYFPPGKHKLGKDEIARNESILAHIDVVFDSRDFLTEEEFVEVTVAIGLPRYANLALYRFVLSKAPIEDDKNGIHRLLMKNVWADSMSKFGDSEKFLFEILKGMGGMYLTPENFLVILEDIVDNHIGMRFLQSMPPFQERYVETVITRYFYEFNRKRIGKLSINEFRESRFYECLCNIEDIIDFNEVDNFFSYKDFYVIYVKFWELDTDHDLYIDSDDLRKYDQGALNFRLVERAVHGHGRPYRSTLGQPYKPNLMSYTDFVWFLMSEVDKSTPQAIEYWFRCIDLDSDGVISLYELEHFYEEQVFRLYDHGVDTLNFEDLACQTFDIVKPNHQQWSFTLKDLKQCPQANVFIDTFVNLANYISYEKRYHLLQQQMAHGPRSEIADLENLQVTGEDIADIVSKRLTDWQHYVDVTYQALVQQESQQDRRQERITKKPAIRLLQRKKRSIISTKRRSIS